MSEGTLTRSLEPFCVSCTLLRASYIASWNCFNCLDSWLVTVSTMSQVNDEGSSEAVLVLEGSLAAHFDSSSQLFDFVNFGIGLGLSSSEA